MSILSTQSTQRDSKTSNSGKIAVNSTKPKQIHNRENTPKDKRTRPLTVKERKFIASKVSGDTNAKAYEKAGYKLSTRASNDVNASKVLNKPKIQEAINIALEHHGATPEYAVGRIKQVADTRINNSSNLPSILKASEKILELHGWHREARPVVQLDIKNASFYGNSRGSRTIDQ